MLHMTPWERSALQLLADGKTTNEVAHQLRSNTREVEMHLETLFARMGAANRGEAIAAAIRRGLLSFDERP